MMLFLNLLICLICCNLCFGSFTKDDAGTTAAQFLKLGAGARATAMGDAFVGISDDATAVYWNPAGLSQIKNKSISFMHAVWFEDISYDWFSYVHPAGNIGTFGIGAQYLNYGDIKGMDESGIESGLLKPNDLAATFSYARGFSNISFGISIKYISSKIRETAIGCGYDIGIMYKHNKLRIGTVVQNIGTKLKFVNEEDPLPMNIKLGLAYNINDNWIVSSEANAPVDNEINYGAGSEYNLKLNDKITIAGRVGYNTRTKDTGGLNGITAGLGINVFKYNIDYAFVPFGDLGDTHRMSFQVKF